MKIGFLSLVLALGVAFFSIYQFDKHQKFVANTQATLKQIDAEIKPEIAQLQAQLTEIKQEEQWKVAEAAYLVRLAVEQWQVSRDPIVCIRLLAAADQALQSLQDPRFIPLRESLKQDQLALKAVKLPDKEGLWLALTTLIQKISDLPTHGLRNTVPKENTGIKADAIIETKTGVTQPITQQSEKQNWKTALQHNLQKFRDLVKIQHHQKPIEPILSESQQALAQETLRLLLEQTRWSVLHNNTAVYQTSIQQSVEWLNTYFEPNDEQVKQVQAALSELATVSVQPKLPEIGSALQLLPEAR